MALSSFSDRYAMYDVTPVENLFLLEYMPFAPGDSVRVYLYGLMQCHHPDADATLEGMARVLNMRTEEVLAAFRFWEQKGLVVGMSDNPPRFEYVNVRSAMLQSGAEEDGAYRYRDFNNQLQAMLGLLHPQQFQKAMEWVEDLKLPTDVVLMMVREKLLQLTEGGKKKRSLPYLFKAFEQTALDFAQRGIRTAELCEKELSRGRPGFKLAGKVLDYFNLRRSPTTAEVELASKWLEVWELHEKDVMGALKQTAGSSNPSFAYLDKILQRHLLAAKDGGMERSIEVDRQLFDATKQILLELGQSGVPSQSQRESVQRHLDMGFEQDVLVRAAVRCNRSGRRTFDQWERELARFYELGITTSEAAEEYNHTREELRRQAILVFDKAGLDRRPVEADLDQMKEWLKAAPFELVLYAAQCANGLKLPTRAMQKNLSEWAQRGIVDVQGASSERAARRQGAKKPAPTPTPAQSYSQRSYEQGFFEDFFAELGDEKGEGTK